MKIYNYKVRCYDDPTNLNFETIGTVIAESEAEATKLIYQEYLPDNTYVKLEELKEIDK